MVNNATFSKVYEDTHTVFLEVEIENKTARDITLPHQSNFGRRQNSAAP